MAAQMLALSRLDKPEGRYRIGDQLRARGKAARGGRR